jgi:hypothetical protein
MSSSGDGTIRFWDYAAGIELYVVDCNGAVPTNDTVEKFTSLPLAATCQLLAVQVNSRWDLFQNIAPAVLLPLLYKHKVDNIKVYQESKKQRLAGILASSCSDTSKIGLPCSDPHQIFLCGSVDLDTKLRKVATGGNLTLTLFMWKFRCILTLVSCLH